MGTGGATLTEEMMNNLTDVGATMYCKREGRGSEAFHMLRMQQGFLLQQGMSEEAVEGEGAQEVLQKGGAIRGRRFRANGSAEESTGTQWQHPSCGLS